MLDQRRNPSFPEGTNQSPTKKLTSESSMILLEVKSDLPEVKASRALACVDDVTLSEEVNTKIPVENETQTFAKKDDNRDNTDAVQNATSSMTLPIGKPLLEYRPKDNQIAFPDSIQSNADESKRRPDSYFSKQKSDAEEDVMLDKTVGRENPIKDKIDVLAHVVNETKLDDLVSNADTFKCNTYFPINCDANKSHNKKLFHNTLSYSNEKRNSCPCINSIGNDMLRNSYYRLGVSNEPKKNLLNCQQDNNRSFQLSNLDFLINETKSSDSPYKQRVGKASLSNNLIPVNPTASRESSVEDLTRADVSFLHNKNKVLRKADIELSNINHCALGSHISEVTPLLPSSSSQARRPLIKRRNSNPETLV